MKASESYYDQLEEPVKSCFLALHHFILSQDKDIAPAWEVWDAFLLL